MLHRFYVTYAYMLHFNLKNSIQQFNQPTWYT